MENGKGLRNAVAEQFILQWIKEEHPEWVEEDGSCERCEEYYRIMDKLVKPEAIYG